MTDLEQKCNEYREYKRLAEQAEQMRDSLRDEIIAMMQGAPEVVAGVCKVMYKDVQSVRLDSKLLKTLHPDVYAECSSKTSYKRFSVV
jgi:predicted phage-related endonuclease